MEKKVDNEAASKEGIDQRAGQQPGPTGSGKAGARERGQARVAGESTGDYRVLSERLVEMSRYQQDAQVRIDELEARLKTREAEVRRLKAERTKDLDRLAAVSRTRDLLEKRSASQMAKVAAALARASESTPAPELLPAPVEISGPEKYAFVDEAEQADGTLGWSDRRWWMETIRVGQKAHKERRLSEARTAFELALRRKQTASLWEQLGHVLREDGQFAAAESAYGRSLKMRPGKGELIFLSGYCLELSGRRSDAIRLYEQALATEPALASRYEHLRDFHARLAH